MDKNNKNLEIKDVDKKANFLTKILSPFSAFEKLITPDKSGKVPTTLEDRIQQLAVVAHLSQKALINDNTSELIKEIVDEISKTLNVELCQILELLPGKDGLLHIAGIGWSDELIGKNITKSTNDFKVIDKFISPKPLAIEDLPKDKELKDFSLLFANNIMSLASVVIHGTNQPFGVLGVYSHTKRKFTKYEVNFLESVANILSSAIERNRAEQHLTLQHAVARILAEQIGSKEAIQKILQSLSKNLSWDVGIYWEYKSGIKKLVFQNIWHSIDIKVSELEKFKKFAVGQGFPGQILKEQKPVVLEDIGDSKLIRRETALKLGMQSLVGFPISVGDKILGVMEFFSGKTYRIDEDLTDVLRSVGSQIGQFIDAKNSEDELKKSKGQLETIFQGVADGITVQDRDGNIIFANEAAARIMGYHTPNGLLRASKEEIFEKVEMRDEFGEIFPMDILPGILALKGIVTPDITIKMTRGGQEIGWFVIKARSVFDKNGNVLFAINILHDITERKEAENAMRESEERYRRLVELSPEAIGVHKNGKILYMNPAGAKLFGGDALAEMIGKDLSDFVAKKYKKEIENLIEKKLNDKQRSNIIEQQFVRLDGKILDIEFSSSAIRYDGIPAMQIIARDVTDRKHVEKQVYNLAFYDQLTELPNRALFQERLVGAITNAQQNNSRVAVMFIDLDRFKTVNDSLGHKVGDLLLKYVADRIRKSVRDGDTVSRQGGDEFTLVIPDLHMDQEAANIAQKVISILSEPFIIEGHEINISPSIGIALYPSDTDDVDRLVMYADAAMYKAKKKGGNLYKFYTTEVYDNALERLTLENNLRKALTREELVVLYQPKFNLNTGKITGMEALLRWNHPKLGMISPLKFIPIAEESGLIVRITEKVLRKACVQNKELHDLGYKDLGVAVNVSPRHFDQNLVETVDKILRETRMEAKFLELEITEDTIMQSSESTTLILNQLMDRGIKVSIDDFGIGYSSLSYLKRLPIDSLKIDRSFIQNITTDPSDEEIATAIVSMAHNLELEVIAEGVETKEQVELLKEYGCDQIQGFYISEPIGFVELKKFLKKRR
jgi:diguanylate cyclase (GGDEF)-like protein/PAS domain S-box-containing protein